MGKGTPDFAAERRDEIMRVCERLYRTMSFKEVTLKEIGNATPFSRPTIYNYFESKEEIFLALFEREYVQWSSELESLLDSVTAENLALCVAASLEKRELMLKLLAVNLYDMEENSRKERLVEFKKAYGRSKEAFSALLRKAFPEKPEGERGAMLIAAYEFLHGVYPYAHATEKQKNAMDEAGVRYEEKSICELALYGLKKILV
ncbi:MAG: TetR family transcriptional regulator [Clostridia bacterium]|nr:TetR family transcriptional regulator [Clostridia bacterium]